MTGVRRKRCLATPKKMAIWTRAEYFGWRDLLLVKLMLILANSTVGCFAGSDAVTIGTKWIMTNLWQTYDSRLVLSPKWVEINQLSNDREFTIISSYTHLKFRRLFLVEVVGRGNKKTLKKPGDFEEYIEMVLPMHCRARVSIEAGTDHSWGRFIGIDSWRRKNLKKTWYMPGTPSVLFFKATLPLKPATIATWLSRWNQKKHQPFLIPGNLFSFKINVPNLYIYWKGLEEITEPSLHALKKPWSFCSFWRYEVDPGCSLLRLPNHHYLPGTLKPTIFSMDGNGEFQPFF